jgi:hypothetical protein
LKETHFSHFTVRNTAGGDIGDTPVFKIDTAICNVLISADNGNPAGINRLYRTMHKAEDKINVVNHQIQHDRHIRTPGIKVGHPMRFNKQGVDF